MFMILLVHNHRRGTKVSLPQRIFQEELALLFRDEAKLDEKKPAEAWGMILCSTCTFCHLYQGHKAVFSPFRIAAVVQCLSNKSFIFAVYLGLQALQRKFCIGVFSTLFVTVMVIN